MSVFPLPPPRHLPETEPCPFLPLPPTPLSADCIAGLGNDRGPLFYLTALRYAQSLWLQGFPARSILLLNRAFGADIAEDDPVLHEWPLPYAAMAWILRHHRPEHFIGNPRRHWQHLATRMSGPRPELRTWRAWACWQLARTLLPHLPPDELQLARENVTEPDPGEIARQLRLLGHSSEMALWHRVLATLSPLPPPPAAQGAEPR